MGGFAGVGSPWGRRWVICVAEDLDFLVDLMEDTSGQVGGGGDIDRDISRNGSGETEAAVGGGFKKTSTSKWKKTNAWVLKTGLQVFFYIESWLIYAKIYGQVPRFLPAWWW
ncbi:Uncharacterized protein Fot_10515 [Forsythia ovata]|uniref:Uncharacterized protein n=1 Tax=Forsythia ovata TaxID=205694 RepID=A0ABD1WH13_9LAMI